MAEKFCVNDYVVAVRQIDGRVQRGTTGIIWKVTDTHGDRKGDVLSIQWDTDVGGHDGDGSMLKGHCWNVYAEDVTHMCHEIPDSECDTDGIEIIEFLFG